MWESGKLSFASPSCWDYKNTVWRKHTPKSKLTVVRNLAELAEGWYDPATLQKAQESAPPDSQTVGPQFHEEKTYSGGGISDDDVGPALPGDCRSSSMAGKRSGPAIPDLQDLELQRGMRNLLQKLPFNSTAVTRM